MNFEDLKNTVSNITVLNPSPLNHVIDGFSCTMLNPRSGKHRMVSPLSISGYGSWLLVVLNYSEMESKVCVQEGDE